MPIDLMAGWQNDLASHRIGKDVKDYKLIIKTCIQKKSFVQAEEERKEIQRKCAQPHIMF